MLKQGVGDQQLVSQGVQPAERGSAEGVSAEAKSEQPSAEPHSASGLPAADAAATGLALGAYRLRSRQPLQRGEAEDSLWRRLFRIVDRPQNPPILVDCDSLGVAATEQLTDSFWKTPELCQERNLILVASAESPYQEVADHCRIAQPEDVFPVGENWGVLILESPAEEFPPLLHLATELGGSIVTTRQAGGEQTEPVHCAGIPTDASLEADRDSALERLLGIRLDG